MVAKKQPDPDWETIDEAAYDWFCQFFKHLEIYVAETGQGISSDSGEAEYGLAVLRAMTLTLRDSGLQKEQIVGLFGRVALESLNWIISSPNRSSRVERWTI